VPFRQKKVPTKVTFETLLSVDTEKPPYHLRGVVVHEGEAGEGHYTAFVRAPDNFWYDCQDGAPPRLARIDEVLGAEAYLLFYEQ
jgi:ubiquitin C-terminal hydrolase